MKISLSLAVSLLFFVFALHAQDLPDLLYVGTFDERGSEGIYVVEFDREAEKLTLIQTLGKTDSPTYLELHPAGDLLYSVNRKGTEEDPESGSVSVYQIDPDTGKLNPIQRIPSHGAGSCHISVDPTGRAVFVSHYASSHFAMFPINPNGTLDPPSYLTQFSGRSQNPQRQNESHMHSAVADAQGKYLYISDLGTDLILQFGISDGELVSVNFADSLRVQPGSGPRHFLIHPNGQLAFSIEELTSTVSLYSIDTESGNLHFLQREDLIHPKDRFEGTNTAADIQLTPDGRFLYASNRGLDNLVIFKVDSHKREMTPIGKSSSYGAHPRGIRMDNQGEYLFVTNKDSDNLVVLKIDPETGQLSSPVAELPIPGAVVVRQRR